MAKFKPGESGNPWGRPKGVPDRRTKLRRMLEDAGPDLIQRLISMAKAGNLDAIRLCISKLLPPLRPISEPMALEINLSGNSMEQARTVLKAVSDGKISIDDAGVLLHAVAETVKIQEITELEARISALEKKEGEDDAIE